MNIGMLWFDNDPKAEINAKIKRAAEYYHNKYGVTPNLCFIHPSMVNNGSLQTQDERMQSGNIEVRTSRSVLPNHFWIGINGGAGSNGAN
jgi:hypothetical protein